MILTPKYRVNMRVGQGTHTRILGTISTSAQVVGGDYERDFLGTQHWLYVTVNGVRGFIRGDLLQVAGESAPQIIAKWEHGHAVVGVHGPSAELWAWVGDNTVNQHILREARFESVKILCAADAGWPVVEVIRNNGARVDVARLYIDMTTRKSPAQYVEEVRQPARNLYLAGVRYFEVHNEPNLTQEGFGSNWQNGAEFARWWLQVVALLRPMMPLAKWGFSAMSPGHATDFRAEPTRFFNEAREAWQAADWLAFHTYWQGNGDSGWQGALAAVRGFALAHPDKVVHVTEFSNVSPLSEVGGDEKGRQYVRLYQQAKLLPQNVGALFVFGIDLPGFPNESLRVMGNASIIGKR